MTIIEKIGEFAGKWMAAIAVVCAAIALFASDTIHALIPTTLVNPLLGVVMLGVGLTLKLSDFKVVFSNPKAVIAGILAQFIIMPGLAFFLCIVFQLPAELSVGVILVGACPGGASSNVITYLAKGDVALSVGMTCCTTLLSPIVTPALVMLLAGEAIEVSYLSMFLSIVQVVLVPIALGFLANFFLPKFSAACVKVLPLVSVVAISLIIMSVVSATASELLEVGFLIFAVVALHNVLGYVLGYVAAHALGLTRQQARTISIEVGMQNSGLATSLATVHFVNSPLTAVPGAIFSIWHNISGAIYANVLSSRSEEIDDDK